MSQKKCPKCGESNPVEAVMCWACYTPLSGAAAAGGPSAAPPGASSSEREKTRKPVPMWQVGVLGVALLCGVGYGAMALMGGAPAAETVIKVSDGPASQPSTTSPSTVVIPTFAPSGGTTSGAPVPSVAPVSGTNATTGQATFTLSVPPKRGIQWGTMGIVPTSAVNEQDAAGMAATASRQMAKTGSWDGLYVFVFQTPEAAAKFRRYQKGRNGDILKDQDYAALQDLWSSTLVRYDYSRGNESIRYPSKNPGGWWNGTGKFVRSRS